MAVLNHGPGAKLGRAVVQAARRGSLLGKGRRLVRIVAAPDYKCLLACVLAHSFATRLKPPSTVGFGPVARLVESGNSVVFPGFCSTSADLGKRHRKEKKNKKRIWGGVGVWVLGIRTCHYCTK